MGKVKRIIFMGTPEFAAYSLGILIEHKFNIVGVITAPDRQAGRGRKLRESAVKALAKEHGLKILQPTNLKDLQFLDDLRGLQADLQIVVAFRMLPKAVWDMPSIGTINLHASLLPDYRGAAPINWAIINGEKKSGVTTFFINEKIDTGSIILKEEVEIGEDTSAGDLHDELMVLGSRAIINTVELLESNNYELLEQPLAETKSAPKLNKENCKIDWNDSLSNIFNKIRGLSPYPGAWTELYNNKTRIELKIIKAKKEVEIHDWESGKVLFTKKEIRIAVNGGYINVLKLKLSGKRTLDSQNLLNGYTFSKDSKVL